MRVNLFQLFYDWCVVMPARVLDALILIPVAFAPFTAPWFTWSWLVDGITWRTRLSLYVKKFVGWTITLYVLAVSLVALIEFPNVMRRLIGG